MSQHALLRSVKGLGIPGTARKEDRKTKLKVATPAPAVDRQKQTPMAKIISPRATACAAPACT